MPGTVLRLSALLHIMEEVSLETLIISPCRQIQLIL